MYFSPARSPVWLIKNARPARKSCLLSRLDQASARPQRFRPLSLQLASGGLHTSALPVVPHLSTTAVSSARSFHSLSTASHPEPRSLPESCTRGASLSYISSAQLKTPLLLLRHKQTVASSRSRPLLPLPRPASPSGAQRARLRFRPIRSDIHEP